MKKLLILTILALGACAAAKRAEHAKTFAAYVQGYTVDSYLGDRHYATTTYHPDRSFTSQVHLSGLCVEGTYKVEAGLFCHYSPAGQAPACFEIDETEQGFTSNYRAFPDSYGPVYEVEHLVVKNRRVEPVSCSK